MKRIINQYYGNRNTGFRSFELKKFSLSDRSNDVIYNIFDD